MIKVSVKSVDDIKQLLEANEGKLIYISAYPCADCEAFEALLETMLGDTDSIVKVEVPVDEEVIDYIVNLGIKGAPSIILPDGKVLDDFDVYELAKKVVKYVKDIEKA